MFCICPQPNGFDPSTTGHFLESHQLRAISWKAMCLMVFGACSIPSTGGFGCSASVRSQMVSIHQLRAISWKAINYGPFPGKPSTTGHFLESHVLNGVWCVFNTFHRRVWMFCICPQPNGFDPSTTGHFLESHQLRAISWKAMCLFTTSYDVHGGERVKDVGRGTWLPLNNSRHHLQHIGNFLFSWGNEFPQEYQV